MELNGDIFIGASPEQVWRGLNDPQVLLASIPGCEEVQQKSATETHVRVLIKMGPVRARFVGKVLMSEVRPGQGCMLNFEGSGGAAGFAKGSSTVTLQAEEGGTRLSYTAAASVGGKLGQIGGRMIDASARQTADQFFQAFAQQVGAPPAPEADAAVAAAPAPQPGAPAVTMPAPLQTAIRAAAPAPPPSAVGEGVRVLWFTLGVAATAFGFWLACALR
jgi:carbon monoxide dehydrogenase subunit G